VKPGFPKATQDRPGLEIAQGRKRRRNHFP